jgi:hypothetical protein
METCLYQNISLKTNVKLYLKNETYLMQKRKWKARTLMEYSLLAYLSFSEIYLRRNNSLSNGKPDPPKYMQYMLMKY